MKGCNTAFTVIVNIWLPVFPFTDFADTVTGSENVTICLLSYSFAYNESSYLTKLLSSNKKATQSRVAFLLDHSPILFSSIE